jgi:hypothetical protein
VRWGLALVLGFALGETLRVSRAEATDCGDYETVGLEIESLDVPESDRSFWEDARQGQTLLIPYLLKLPSDKWSLDFEGEP